MPVADKVSHIRLVIKDNNSFTAPPIGHAKVPVSEIAPGQKFDAWVDLLDDREQVVQKKDPLRKHNKVRKPEAAFKNLNQPASCWCVQVVHLQGHVFAALQLMSSSAPSHLRLHGPLDNGLCSRAAGLI